MPRKSKNGSLPRFKVGDWVEYGLDMGRRVAQVIKDVGPVGVQARRFYLLREYPLWTNVQEYELPEDRLQPAERPERLPEPHEAIAVM